MAVHMGRKDYNFLELLVILFVLWLSIVSRAPARAAGFSVSFFFGIFLSGTLAWLITGSFSLFFMKSALRWAIVLEGFLEATKMDVNNVILKCCVL